MNLDNIQQNSNRKKVCIATWYGAANYGTGLQAYALAYFLRKNQYEVYFVGQYNLDKVGSINHMKRYFAKINGFITRRFQTFKRFVCGYRKYQRKYYEDLKKRTILQNRFVNNYNHIFQITCEEDLRALNNKTDIFIAGSDQIWNPYVLELKNLLAIADDDKYKISYASSVGVKHIPRKYHELYKKYIGRLDAISVRENQSKTTLSEIIDREITEVVDPTLLLDTSDWDYLVSAADIDASEFEDKYILCYFVGKRSSYWKYVELIQKTTGFRVVVLPINDESFKNPYDKYAKATPKEFIWLVKHASVVCTDSFHATLFSIQYKKEFYVLKRFADTNKKSQNSRLVDILTSLNLGRRIILDESIFQQVAIDNYDFVESKIDLMRKASQRWLINTLKRT
jgi:hypothetical protein